MKSGTLPKTPLSSTSSCRLLLSRATTQNAAEQAAEQTVVGSTSGAVSSTSSTSSASSGSVSSRSGVAAAKNAAEDAVEEVGDLAGRSTDVKVAAGNVVEDSGYGIQAANVSEKVIKKAGSERDKLAKCSG